MFSVMKGSIVFSSVFAMGESNAIGLYDLPRFVSLFGFGMGMTLASFHMCGIMFLFMAML